MKITVLDNAHQWFKNELEIAPGGYVHFFGKYGGSTNVHTGFSTGMSLEEPTKTLVELNKDGITYYVNENDEWFFSNYDLTVDYDKNKDEPVYTFSES